jgi:hypothetical protein
MDLLTLLREFGAPDSLIALAEGWLARDEEGAEALSDEDLVALHDGLVALADDEEAGVGLLLAAAETAEGIRAEQAARDEAARAEEEAAAEARRRLLGETAQDGDDDAGDEDGDDDTDDEVTEATADEPADETADETADERVPVTASTGPDFSRAARRVAARRTSPADEVPDERTGAAIVFATDVPGVPAGSAARTLADVDMALVRRAGAFRRASSARGREEILVASIEAEYPEERRLVDDHALNTRRVSEAINEGLRPEALAASGGLCAPLTPYYGVEVLGDDYRPVRDSLVGFQASRGGIVSIAPPILPAAMGAASVWTVTTDENPGETTKPCLRVTCGTPRETEMHAVPVCIEYGNFLDRTFGEWTEAWSRLTMIAHARVAEQTLLAAIKSGSTQPNGVDTTVNGVVDVLVALDQAATGFRSRHRIPESFPFRVIAPETWRFMARTNMARALPGGSYQENLTVADAAIDAWFAARNLRVTWTPDLSVIGAQAGSTPLAEPDPTMEFALYPEGTWLFLDGGRLDLGVVRDSTLNSTNDLQVFAETFEGAHKIGAESLWLTINVCPSGAVNGTLDPAALCASYT